MTPIVFIVYPGFELLDLAGPVSTFNGANRALGARGQPSRYRIVVLSADGGPIIASSGVAVETDAIAAWRARTDATVLVVGAEREPLLVALADRRLRAALPRLTARAARFGSVCTGGFVLAAAGLLDGRRVATHWDSAAAFASAFPAVSVDPDALYVVDGPVWTSAGVTTGIDLALALVAADLDAALAGEIAKRLVLYARRPGYQSQFSPILGAQARVDGPFAELIGWIQVNLAERLDVPMLAARAGLGERTFYRKFSAATGQTPARFVETARLETAKLLLSRGLALKVVAARVGLFPTARFVDAFERRFGIGPRLFRALHAVGP